MLFSEFADINPKVRLDKGETYSFVEMEDVSPGNRYVKALKEKLYKGGGSKFGINDVLFARITPCLENGKIAQFKGSNESVGFGSTEFFVFRAKKEVSDSGFLFYLAYSDILRKPAEGSMFGASGRQRAALDAVKAVVISDISLNNQKKVSAILSAYDDLIENNTRRIQILEEMAQRIYREWFVNFRFPGHEKVKFIDSEIGKIPDNWEVVEIGKRFSTVLGGTPSRVKAEYWTDGRIPWINSGKVNEIRIIDESEFITELGLRRSSTKMMPKRATVIAITGATLGQVSMLEIEVCANQSVVGICDSDHVFDEYIYLKFCEIIESVILKAGGGAQQHINKEIVNAEKILIPSTQLIGKFNSIVRPLCDLMENLLIKNKNLKKKRDLLLPKLISGEVDVSEMDIVIKEQANGD